MAEKKLFNADVLLSSFAECNSNIGDIPMKSFMTGVEELKRIVLTLGSAFGMASSDIDEKLGILRERLNDIETKGPAVAAPVAGATGDGPGYTADAAPRPTLQYMIGWECERKVEALNAGKYISGSRSLLRLMWFMDFLAILIRHLLEDTKELKECARDAYDKALGPHHPWIVRTGIHAAMAFCPGKATFWSNLLAESTVTDPSRIRVILASFLEQMEPVREYLWNYYRTRKLDNLP